MVKRAIIYFKLEEIRGGRMKQLIKEQLLASSRVKELMAEALCEDMAEAVKLLATAYRSGNKVLVCGNGGSAADAQHMAGELVGRFKLERRALPCIALTTDTSILTAVANDYDYTEVFARQVEGLAESGDIVLGISTSGNSENVLAALSAGRAKGAKTIALSGRGGGKLNEAADLNLVVPSDDTPRIQEGHITLIHILCDLLEKELFLGA